MAKTKTREGMRQLSCWVKESTLADIEALANDLRRPIAEEVQHALERHYAARPTLAVPEVPPAKVEPPAKPPGAKRGRKRKEASPN